MVSNRSNGINRGIIAALVGLILIGAAELPKKDAQPEQAKEHREIADTLKDIAASLKDAQKPDQTTQPCDPKKPNRNSDLCAQWKAADAAADAAEAAWRQILIGWIGIVLGAITMVAAIAAAKFAKKAAEASEENASAAIDAVLATNKANEIAREAIDIQHRPVMVFEDIGILIISPGCFLFKAIWKNIGSSPALIIECGISREFMGAVPKHDMLQIKLSESSNVSNTREIVRVDQGPVKPPEMLVDADSLALTKGIDHEAADILRREGRSIATAEFPLKDYINGQCKIVCWVKYINVFSKENTREYDSKNISSFAFNIDGEGRILPQMLGGSVDEMT